MILGRQTLKPSSNDYDWLGKGIYFWEHGPERALEWAGELKKRGKIEKPAVLGAVIHLGRCFDLLDTRYTRILGQQYPAFSATLDKSGQKLPENIGGKDLLLRKLDCAVINWTLEALDSGSSQSMQSLRGVFQEGEMAYEGSSIHQKSHIQIAIRDQGCILGYFVPSSVHGD